MNKKYYFNILNLLFLTMSSNCLIELLNEFS